MITIYEVQLNSSYWVGFKKVIKGLFDTGMLDLVDLTPQGFYLISAVNNETIFISPILLIHIQLDPSLEKLYREKY